jgi:hypothetical protein
MREAEAAPIEIGATTRWIDRYAREQAHVFRYSLGAGLAGPQVAGTLTFAVREMTLGLRPQIAALPAPAFHDALQRTASFLNVWTDSPAGRCVRALVGHRLIFAIRSVSSAAIFRQSIIEAMP